MVPELEKARVTEIQVRMDCNGCVQKIKKALHGINVVGWADPEKIIKAIKKTRKIATICSHYEHTASQSTEPTPEGGPPAPDASNPPPTETPPTEANPPAEPPKDPPPPENPPPEVTPSPIATETAANQPFHPSGPKDVEEKHHPHDYGHGYSGHWNNHPNSQGYWNNHPNSHGYWNNYPNDHGSRPQPPVYITQNYNTYKPSPSITEYEYVRSPPQHNHYSRVEHISDEYHNRSSNGDGNNNITSMFSDENPNACRIV